MIKQKILFEILMLFKLVLLFKWHDGTEPIAFKSKLDFSTA